METVPSTLTTLSLLLLLLQTTNNAVTTAALTSQELDAALFALRSSGYTLFPNAITTSDLHTRLLSPEENSSSAFTLFAPPDSHLFSLDLLSSAQLYTFSLLHHVSPRFLSTSDLLSLPRPAHIDTLLPNRQLLVENTLVFRNGTVLLSVTLDGVGVLVPDLFLGSNIAVHGLDRILVARNEPRVSQGIGFAEAPESWCETCVSPANPPASFRPMRSGVPVPLPVPVPGPGPGPGPVPVPRPVTLDKDGGSDLVDDHDCDDLGINKGARHGTFFRFKRFLTL